MALRTGSALVDETILAAGYLVKISCTTIICLLSGMGPNKSILTLCHGRDGIFTATMGSFVVVGLNSWHDLQFLTPSSTMLLSVAGLEVSPSQGNDLSLPEYLFRGNDRTKLRFPGK